MKKIYYIIIVLLICSCASRKEIVYLQDSKFVPENNYEKYAPRIQKEDLLTITISASDLKATVPFNQVNAYQANVTATSDFTFKPTYLVDNNGDIDFPILGKIKLLGLNRLEATELMKNKLSKYIVHPGVNLTFANFRITVLGEVNKPGTYNLPQEKVTIFEALGLAGDMTIKGMRNNVLVMRETSGDKKFERLNLLTDSVVNSPYFYLAQNDVVYVEPNNSQVRNSRFGQSTNVWISVTSLVITIITLVVTNSRK